MNRLTTEELKDMLDNWQNQLALELNKGYNNSHTALFASKIIALCVELLQVRKNGKEN